MFKRLLRGTCVAVGALTICGAIIAGANYAVTVGSGTNFGSIVVSAVHYAQQLVCDPTTPSQCAAVDSSGVLTTKASVVGSGTQATAPRVTLATDSPGIVPAGTAGTPSSSVLTIQGISSMTKLLVTPDANSAINVAQVGGSSLALGSTTATASVPVVLASNQTAADPCMFQLKTNVAISTATGTTGLVNGVSAKKIYVCSFSLIAPSAVSVSLAEGSSATCGTSAQAAVIGVATNGTAANGMPLAANGGLTIGNGGGTIAQTATAANALCLFQSGTAQLAGNLTYVQQ